MSNYTNKHTQSGKIVKIFPVQQVSDKFQKREFWMDISDHPDYGNGASFEFTQGGIAYLDGYKVGDEVEVTYSIQGRTYDKKDNTGKGMFTSLRAWRIEHANQVAAPAPVAEVVNAQPVTDDDDDLPF